MGTTGGGSGETCYEVVNVSTLGIVYDHEIDGWLFGIFLLYHLCVYSLFCNLVGCGCVYWEFVGWVDGCIELRGVFGWVVGIGWMFDIWDRRGKLEWIYLMNVIP